MSLNQAGLRGFLKRSQSTQCNHPIGCEEKLLKIDYLCTPKTKYSSDSLTLSEALTKTIKYYGKRIERTDFAQRELLTVV